MPLRSWRRSLAGCLVVLATLALTSCGSSSTSASEAVRNLVSGLPVHHNAKPLQVGAYSCSPDGGFYVDQTKVLFYYMRLVPLSDILPLLPAADARNATSLARFGRLLEVVALASNPGASTCGVGLTQTVLETAKQFGGTTKLDPSGLATTVQQSYYDPIRPIVVLASNRLSVCSADVNPGSSVWLFAVFPPVASSIPIAVVNPSPSFGFYLPLSKGALPAAPPSHLYTGDVNQCIQVLSAG
ncbi:MAG: hypothetical protein ACYDC5_00240 [Candidatus Dormibacteria bacterium]